MRKTVIIDEEGERVYKKIIRWYKIKMDSDAEPECGGCGKPLREGKIIYVCDDLNCDLCPQCFKRIGEELSV